MIDKRGYCFYIRHRRGYNDAEKRNSDGRWRAFKNDRQSNWTRSSWKESEESPSARHDVVYGTEKQSTDVEPSTFSQMCKMVSKSLPTAVTLATVGAATCYAGSRLLTYLSNEVLLPYEDMSYLSNIPWISVRKLTWYAYNWSTDMSTIKRSI